MIAGADGHPDDWWCGVRLISQDPTAAVWFWADLAVVQAFVFGRGLVTRLGRSWKKSCAGRTWCSTAVADREELGRS
jgi:hypothetical protein